jgi:polar amino acid transport system substrate-binding protein
MRLSRYGVIVMVLALLFVATSLPGFADGGIQGVSFTGGDGSYKRVVREGIVLGISNDYPYTYLDEKTKQYDGIDVAMFRIITQRLGIAKVSWQLVPFDALIPGLISKRWDVVVDNVRETPERLKVISFTSPPYWYGSTIAVQRGDPKNIHTWADLAGHVVGAVRGAASQLELQKRTDLKALNLYTSNDTEFVDLASGRIDAVYDDDIKIGLFIKQHPGFNMEVAPGYIPQSAHDKTYPRYGLRQDDVDLNWAISRAIDEMRADGTVGTTITQYGLTLRNLWYFPVTK